MVIEAFPSRSSSFDALSTEFSVAGKFNDRKMSVIDILFRIDEVCKKYEKYDVEKQRSNSASPEDAFARLYSTFESQIDLALKVKGVSQEEREDEGLDFISEGLDTLKNLAEDMNEELDRQVPLVDEIETKVDKATAELKNTNLRLKETINNVFIIY
nr:syntaxin-71-like [Ipomoea batatas]